MSDRITPDPKSFHVTFEVRATGAIGSFENKCVDVTMWRSSFCDADVYREAGKALRADGYETRFFVSLEPIVK